MEVAQAGRQTPGVPKIKPRPKSERRRTFIRAWRQYRGIDTLEQMSDRLETQTGLVLSASQISRIETNESGYTQDVLEAFAKVLRAEPGQLLNVDPTRGEDAIWSIYETLTPPQRRQAEQMMRVIKGERTGTEDQ